jgi:hypothetical protein
MHPTQKLARPQPAQGRDADSVADPGDLYGTPADTLRCAAIYLSSYGWIQGDRFGRPDGHLFPPASADGAIRAVVYGYPNKDAELEGKLGWYVDRATAVLADWLGLNDPLDADTLLVWLDRATDAVADWNDDLERRPDDVVRALQDAADDYDRSHPAHRTGGTQ